MDVRPRNQAVAEFNTGSVTRNNNDHVLSFDGTMMGISSASQDPADGNRSVVWVLPATGGEPKRVTANSPSSPHGWSPDKKWLFYTGQRNNELDLYKISVDGGEEIRLTTTEGVDDGSELTPDGQWICFNSNRSGHMQIWRMKPDGSDQQQITFDRFNNWFPHISPDGKSMVIISYGEDIQSGDHPFYGIYLRHLALDGSNAKSLTCSAARARSTCRRGLRTAGRSRSSATRRSAPRRSLSLRRALTRGRGPPIACVLLFADAPSRVDRTMTRTPSSPFVTRRWARAASYAGGVRWVRPRFARGAFPRNLDGEPPRRTGGAPAQPPAGGSGGGGGAEGASGGDGVAPESGFVWLGVAPGASGSGVADGAEAAGSGEVAGSGFGSRRRSRARSSSGRRRAEVARSLGSGSVEAAHSS